MEIDPQEKRFEGMSAQDIIDSVERIKKQKLTGMIGRGTDSPGDFGSFDRGPLSPLPNSGSGAAELPLPPPAA